MSYRRRHRWFRRTALGLAFATAALVGNVSSAFAKYDEGGTPSQQVIPYLSHGMLTEADVQAAAAEAIHDRTVVSSGSSVPSGDELAVANAIAERELTAAERIQDLSQQLRGEAIESAQTAETFVQGVTDFPRVQVDSTAVRPDDVADRFAHSDVTPQPELAASGGTSIEWGDALMGGIGGVVLALGIALALGYVRRPRLAGL